MKIKLTAVMGCLLGISSVGIAAPLSNCSSATVGSQVTWTCNLFEEAATFGGFPLSLAVSASPGYLVLMESGNIAVGGQPGGTTTDETNQALWSDVLQWVNDGTGRVQQMILSSSPNQFPSVAAVEGSGASWFQLECPGDATLCGPTQNSIQASQYTPDNPGANPNHIYNIFSGDDLSDGVPEPVTTTLMVSGLALLGLLKRRRRA